MTCSTDDVRGHPAARLQPGEFLYLTGQVRRHGAEGAKRLKGLEPETSRLKRLLAQVHHDIEAAKVGLGVNH